MTQEMARPIAGVGVVCLRGDDVLLVRRGKAPFEGRWSIPGGRIEAGERAIEAARRELVEETGVEADIVGLIDVVDAIPTDGAHPHYVLVDYAARWIAGAPRAGDDAVDARFFTPVELAALGLWSETLRVIDAARAMV